MYSWQFLWGTLTNDVTQIGPKIDSLAPLTHLNGCCMYYPLTKCLTPFLACVTSFINTSKDFQLISDSCLFLFSTVYIFFKKNHIFQKRKKKHFFPKDSLNFFPIACVSFDWTLIDQKKIFVAKCLFHFLGNKAGLRPVSGLPMVVCFLV